MDWDDVSWYIAGGMVLAAFLVYYNRNDHLVARVTSVGEIAVEGGEGVKGRYGVAQILYPDGSSRDFPTPWEVSDCGKVKSCTVTSPSLVDMLRDAMNSGEKVAVVISGDRIPLKWISEPLIENVGLVPKQAAQNK